jgi:hypothetical protein
VPVYSFNPLGDRRWTEFVERHPRSSVFHTSGWLEALRRTYGYEPVVYTTSPPATSLTNGVVFCRIRSWLTGRRMVSLPFSDHCEPLVDTPEDQKQIWRWLQDLVTRESWQYIETRPLSSGGVAGPGLEEGSSFWLHMMDLRPPLKDLFHGLHKDCIQRKIRRAEREGLGYEEGRTEVVLDSFYRLFVMTRQRHLLPPQPIDWFRNLMTCLGDQLTIRVASKQGRPIAGILTLRHGDVLVYKYGCSEQSYHNLGAMQSLLWRAIQDAKELGVRTVDLGRSDRNDTGLVTFKERWGATRSPLTYARCAGYSRPRSEGYGRRTAKRVFARMPDWLLAAAGKLLYRHVG